MGGLIVLYAGHVICSALFLCFISNEVNDRAGVFNPLFLFEFTSKECILAQ